MNKIQKRMWLLPMFVVAAICVGILCGNFTVSARADA